MIDEGTLRDAAEREETRARQASPLQSLRLSPWWLLLAGALLVWNLGYAPFWNPDEGRYASSSREMAGLFTPENGVQTGAGDWLVPHLNTLPRLNKPPLIYWLAGGLMRVFGANEWSARLPAALAAVVILVLVWRLGRQMFGDQAGIVAGFAWATSALPFVLGRTCNTDMLLACAMTLALVGIWNAVEGDKKAGRQGEEKSRANSTLLISLPPCFPAFCAGLGFGMALLAKGPVGVALPLLIGFAYLCVAKRWHRVPWLTFVAALALGLLLGLPWFLKVEGAHPGFLANFLVRENFGRLSGAQQYHSPSSKLTYLPIVVGGFLPWSAWLLTTLLPHAKTSPEDAEKRARLYLWLWAGVIVGFFSLSSTKLASYVLPAFPAFALLLAASWKRFEENAFARRLALIGTTLLGVVLIGAAGWFANMDKAMPRGEAWRAFAPAMLAVGATSLAPWLFARRGDWNRAVLAQFLGACGMCAALLGFASRLSAYEDASNLMRWAAPHLPANARLVQFRAFEPGAIFYAGRPMLLVDFQNNSGLDEAAIARSPLVMNSSIGGERAIAAKVKILIAKMQLQAPKLREPKNAKALQDGMSRVTANLMLDSMIRDPRPTVVLLRWKSELLPTSAPFHLWARTNDFALISNRPAPANASPARFDFVGPKRRQELIKSRGFVDFPGENSAKKQN